MVEAFSTVVLYLAAGTSFSVSLVYLFKGQKEDEVLGVLWSIQGWLIVIAGKG